MTGVAKLWEGKTGSMMVITARTGSVTIPGFPVRLSASHVPVAASPRLGEHTAEVLAEVIGLEAEAIRALEDEGVVATASAEAVTV